MKVTPLGKLLRGLRDDRGERLYDMAARLEKPSSFVSAIEFGKKAPPRDLVESVIAIYGLEPNKANEFRRAAELSSRSVKVDLEGAPGQARELALCFARQFNSLEPERVQRLLNVLQEEKEDVRSSC